MPGVINVEAINNATTEFIGLFDAALGNATPMYREYVSMQRSGGQKNTYHWMPLQTSIEELKGSFAFDEMVAYEYSITNKKFGGGFRVPIDAYDDDEGAGLGLYRDKATELGFEAAYHPQVLFAQVLAEGFTKTGPDGAVFISASHPSKDGVGARSNLLSGNPALSQSSFNDARVALMKMKKFNGTALNLVARGRLKLFVSPTLEPTAEAIVRKELVDSGETNVNHNRADIVVIPEFENHTNGTTMWFLCVAGESVPKAILMQERKQPQLYQKTNPETSDHVMLKDEMLYATKARYNMGYGHFETIVGSNGSGS